VARGKVVLLLIIIAACIAYYVVSKNQWIGSSAFSVLFSQAGHASLIAIVLCGVVLSLIYFDQSNTITGERRFMHAFLFALAMLVVGFVLRPYYQISKIYATPTWSLYSAAICCFVFSFTYWLVDLKKINAWTSFFKPAASNPLLTYIIPFIIYALMGLFNLGVPEFIRDGFVGVLWSISCSVAVMALVIGLNKLSIRLQL
jgi:predicted acyltransferase